MSISREEVLRIAALANLELGEDEVSMYSEQLTHILTYIDKLNEVDIRGIEVLAKVLFPGNAPAADAEPHSEWPAAMDSLRDDEVRPADVAQSILKQAPNAQPPYFRVPRVIER